MSLLLSQLAALKAELNNDPKGLGYTAKLAVGDQSGVATLLNTVRSGGDYQVPNEPVAPQKIIAQISPADLSAMNGTQVNNLGLLLSVPLLDLNDTNTLADVLTCLPNPGDSRTNVTNLSRRQGTRGEVLFATNGLRLTANDVSNALSS